MQDNDLESRQDAAAILEVVSPEAEFVEVPETLVAV
jgi:hypothetical protein